MTAPRAESFLHPHQGVEPTFVYNTALASSPDNPPNNSQDVLNVAFVKYGTSRGLPRSDPRHALDTPAIKC